MNEAAGGVCECLRIMRMCSVRTRSRGLRPDLNQPTRLEESTALRAAQIEQCMGVLPQWAQSLRRSSAVPRHGLGPLSTGVC